jgi:meso-butanediol dehydrogenase / (S,S)-butanediol dehydrogenase / diacetyl reductase
MRLENKVAIITGAGKGIGEAAVAAFCREGAAVVAVDIDAEAGNAVVDRARSLGGQALFVQANVALAGDCSAMVETAVGRYGGLDVLYANAAVQLHGHDVRAHELSEDTWDRTFAVNAKGVWLCTKYAIPAMLTRGGGSIIIAGSPTGLKAAPPYTAYSATKGAVTALTRTMAAEYGADGIRVNAVVPGATDTPLNRDIFAIPKIRDHLIAQTPMGRLGQAEDVVGVLVFLASDDSRFCTGGLYMADGGISAT